MNARIHGLGKELIPIKALYVRICRYSGLAGQERLDGAAGLSSIGAARFEKATNALPPNRLRPQVFNGDCSPSPRDFFLTFANETQNVSIGEQGSCSIPTNTLRTAEWTATWRSVLSDYISPWGPLTAVRAEVTDIKVYSVPESPVMNWSAERKQWDKVLSLLPAQIPRPTNANCTVGPALTVHLRSGAEIDYACKLPPSILAARNYIISLGP